MTGAELLQQVREALWDTSNALVPGTLESSRADALAALDGAVLLTREEADWLAISLGWEAVAERSLLQSRGERCD